MVRAVRKSMVVPIGERVAALESDHSALADAMANGFKDVGGKLDTLNKAVEKLVTAEAERIGAANERKKFVNRRDVMFTAVSGFLGGIAGYFSHG